MSEGGAEVIVDGAVPIRVDERRIQEYIGSIRGVDSRDIGHRGEGGKENGKDWRCCTHPNRAGGHISAVGRSEEQQTKSIDEVNKRLLEQESRRRDEQEQWNAPSRPGARRSDEEEGLECARGACGGSGSFPSPHEKEIDLDRLYEGGWFVDDVKGGQLDKDKVIQARRLEMDFFRKMGSTKR